MTDFDFKDTDTSIHRAKKKRQKLSGVVDGSSGGSTGDGRGSSGGHRHKH